MICDDPCPTSNCIYGHVVSRRRLMSTSKINPLNVNKCTTTHADLGYVHLVLAKKKNQILDISLLFEALNRPYHITGISASKIR